MQIGDLVRSIYDNQVFGIVLEIIDVHWETCRPSAIVQWMDGLQECYSQFLLEVIPCK